VNIRKIIREELDNIKWVQDHGDYSDAFIIKPYQQSAFGGDLYVVLGYNDKGIRLMKAGGIRRNIYNQPYAHFIFNTKNEGVVIIRDFQWEQYRKLNEEEKELVNDAIKSNKHQDYLNILTSDTNLYESEDPLKWIKDVKTNDDIAQEIYDELEWDALHKRPHIVRNQWNDIPFSVRPSQKKESAIIIPSVFYKGYRDYMRKKWGIYDPDIQKEIYFKIRYLMYQKVKTYN